MEYSHEFPINKKKAETALNKFFSDAKINFTIDKSSVEKNDIFRGWQLLSERFSPNFIEKSPHHLHSWSALQLMLEFSKQPGAAEIKFIGLIRNPIDTLYSMWIRWHVIPEKSQYEWLRAYKNLIKLKSIAGKQLLLVRYEDLTNDQNCLGDIFGFIGVKNYPELQNNLHSNSIQKWKNDNYFGFQIDNNVLSFAKNFYTKELLNNSKNSFWNLIRIINTPRFKLLVMKLKIIKGLKRLLQGKKNQ